MTPIKFNVAQLLREHIGARREYDMTEASLPLDDVLVLRNIRGNVRFTRTASGVFAHIRAHGVVRMVCVRSLEEFDQPVTVDSQDEFHSVLDVVSGVALPRPTEEDPFFLDENHMADVGEAIREYTLLELPIRPVCEAWSNHPVAYTTQSDDYNDEQEEQGIDKRLEILKSWVEQGIS